MLLEEFGHAIDRRLNPGLDSAGDEGELFSDLVSGAVLSPEEYSRIIVEDDAGTLSLDGANVAVEFAAATVQSLAVTNSADGWYCTGEAIDVDVVFSGNENVSGTPYINIVVGSTTRKANYSGGTGSNTLTFSYTPVAGDSDSDGMPELAGGDFM